MQEVLGDLVYVNLLIYVDYVLIYAEDCEKLLVAIEIVWEHFRHYGIFLKAKKCELFAKSIVWCGHIVNEHGCGINSEYPQAVQSIPEPFT